MTTDGDEAEEHISHFIPSVELKGSRADKLRKLDTFIAYLEGLRHSLAGKGPAVPRMAVTARLRRWFDRFFINS